jgi:hypothetical protein
MSAGEPEPAQRQDVSLDAFRHMAPPERGVVSRKDAAPGLAKLLRKAASRRSRHALRFSAVHSRRNRTMRIVVAGFAISAIVVAGCASYPAPTDHLANSYANIRAAEAIGAAQTPQAALHLKLAHEEQSSAQKLASDGDNEQADYMTARANADAELAMSLARETQAQGRANGAAAKVDDAQRDAAKQPPAPGTTSATTTTTSTTVPVPANGSK